jgi:phage repressor protein C with HTH and peptisase S24 domain
MDTMVNLRLFRKSNSLTQDNVAAYLGTTKGFISQVENGRAGLPDDKLQRLLENENGWSLDGLVKESIVPVDGPNTVPLLPIFAQAGSLVGWSDGIEEVKCERVISPVKDVDMAVHIYGESMYPDIPNGSVCYVRRVSGRIIDWGRAYILDTVDGPVLKYLTPGADDEHIRCQSANHDPKFAPFEVLKSDILGMYRVVMCMRMM